MQLNKRTKWLFIILVIYIFFQFFWWAYLIYNLNAEIISLKLKCNPISITNNQQHVSALLKKKIGMVVGEGSIFFLLLSIGIYQIYKSIIKQNQLAQQQTNFMLSVTHELKTPITSTRLQLETLLKRELTPEKKEKIIKNAIADIDRLNQLIDNILFASRVETTHLVTKPEKINLHLLIKDLIEKSNLFYYQQHRIKIETPTYEPIVFTDKLFITTILINLIENALKYSENEVIIKIVKNYSEVCIEVIDYGIGISEEEKKFIFNKFYRSGNEITRKTQGTGLGLYIVHQLSKELNAQIKILTNKPQGTIFQLIFKT